MHHTCNYSHLTGKEKQDKAIEDVKWYVGDEMFEKFIKVCKDAKTLEELEFACEFALGISGYPVTAMWEVYHAN